MRSPYSLAVVNAVVGRSAQFAPAAPPTPPSSPSPLHSPPKSFCRFATRHIEYWASGSSTTGYRIESLPTSACHHWCASSWSTVRLPAPPAPRSRPEIQTAPGHSIPPASGPSDTETISSSDHGYGPYRPASAWRSAAPPAATASTSTLAGPVARTVTSPDGTDALCRPRPIARERSRSPTPDSVTVVWPADSCRSTVTPPLTTSYPVGTRTRAMIAPAAKLPMSPNPVSPGSVSAPGGSQTGNQWPNWSTSECRERSAIVAWVSGRPRVVPLRGTRYEKRILMSTDPAPVRLTGTRTRVRSMSACAPLPSAVTPVI